MKNFSAEYIVKKHEDLFCVYARYQAADSDVLVTMFSNETNAKMFCEALNAENECREAAPVKHGEWISCRKPNRLWDIIVFKCSICGCENYNDSLYCPSCGAKTDGDDK